MLKDYTFVEFEKYGWQEVYDELRYDFEGNKDYDSLLFLSGFIYWSIHSHFMSNHSSDDEKKIRELVKYVIGTLLPFVNKQLNEIEKNINVEKQDDLKNFNNWLELEDDLYALASFRSLTHFALYVERQDIEADKVWCYNLKECMGGVFYYANAMILNNTYQNMIKQCPTGYGKSKSDCVIMSFILGYNVNANILKLVGNRNLVVPNTRRLVDMLKSPKFGKVFPKFGKYNCSDDMFKSCQISDGKFSLTESSSPSNFACFNKDTSIDGTRYDFQFYDDITLSIDRENTNAHLKDWGNYLNQWKKRCSNELTVLRFFTGTAYHREDFISRIRKYLSNNRPLLPIYNFKNKWIRYCKTNEDKDSVYITVPKLADLDLGEDKCYCTFPQRNSKKEALKFMHSSPSAYREFMAIEQQQPLPPVSLAFDYAYLKCYDELPKEIVDGNYICEAILDPSRRGKDNYTCLVFKKPINDNIENEWYLVDCYYKQKSAKYSIRPICEMLARHRCNLLSYESNTTDIDLFEEKVTEILKELNCKNTELNPFYSTLNKEEKINKFQDDIKEKMRFPRQGMYNEESDMGKAMSDITNYSFATKMKHDDSIDACAMKCLTDEKVEDIEIEIVNFRF